jgi:cytochrome c oxidase accessory protein FixG
MSEPGKKSSGAAMARINWGDFRDHLSTADQEGRRKWLYPKKPRGAYYRARNWFNAFLVLVMFAGPFIKINGNPLLMIDIVERRFSVLGVIFWPQDNLIFALGLLLFLTGIAVFTAAFGRLWCGWACPQTVMMEGVFRRLEYWIEGDAPAQKALDRAPWNARKISKRLLKHSVFLGLSFVIGNTLLAYIIGIEALQKIVTDSPVNHLAGLFLMVLFTLVFYGIFARFREQACTFICPYGRLQSTLLDENSIVVAYDYRRGEKREQLRRGEAAELRRDRGVGDCINCRNCVTVCPTGIDIRDGTQMECVSCTACIDACDDVMTRIHRPKGLIRYASLNGIENGERLKITPRIVGYCVVLLALAGALAALLLTRSPVDTSLLRAPGALFQQDQQGKLSNLYLLKLTNKTHREMAIELRLLNRTGRLTVLGGQLNLPAEKQTQASVLVELTPEQLPTRTMPIEVGVFAGGKRVDTITTTFIGPSK